MRPIVSVLAALAVTAALVVAMAGAALADPPPVTGGGSKGKGATVFHCSQFGLDNGVFVITPSGKVHNNQCF